MDDLDNILTNIDLEERSMETEDTSQGLVLWRL